MSKINTFFELLRHNPKGIRRAVDARVSNWILMRCIPDVIFLKIRYRLCINKKLNLIEPVGFNEKLQWLKLYYRNNDYERLVDKYEAKKYVKEHYPDVNIIPTIGVWNSADDIDINTLPEQVVLKCTHDSGSVVLCNDKKEINKGAIRNKLNKALKSNMYYKGREWVYKNIRPRIIAEPYLNHDDANGLQDYKFMCFDGEVKCCFVCTDRFSPEGLHVTFFDREWNVLPFSRHYPNRKQGLSKPSNYNEMIRIAELMSRGMPFVRIDLYTINDLIYFGEYTFFPGSGFEEFTPDEWDYKLGDWIKLPERNV